MSAALLVGVLVAVAVALPPGRAAVRERLPAAASQAPATPRAHPSRARPLRCRRAGAPAAPGTGAGMAADLPLLLDLVAAATRSGAPVDVALDVALDVLGPQRSSAGARVDALRRVRAQLTLGAAPEMAWADVPDDLEPLRGPLLLSAATGAPAAELLEAAASQLRRDARRAAEVAAARLGARLVLPLGLCTLPAFVLLGIVPVLLALAGDVLGGL